MSNNIPYYPKTLEEAVEHLLTHLDEASKELLRNTPEKDLINFHDGWGRSIRNNFGMWGGNRELVFACGANYPDGASEVIIKAVWERLQANEIK